MVYAIPHGIQSISGDYFIIPRCSAILRDPENPPKDTPVIFYFTKVFQRSIICRSGRPEVSPTGPGVCLGVSLNMRELRSRCPARAIPKYEANLSLDLGCAVRVLCGCPTTSVVAMRWN